MNNSNKDTLYSGSEWGEFIFSVAGFLKQKNWVKKNVTKYQNLIAAWWQS